jgi:hypothetical protein
VLALAQHRVLVDEVMSSATKLQKVDNMWLLHADHMELYCAAQGLSAVGWPPQSDRPGFGSARTYFRFEGSGLERLTIYDTGEEGDINPHTIARCSPMMRIQYL